MLKVKSQEQEWSVVEQENGLMFDGEKHLWKITGTKGGKISMNYKGKTFVGTVLHANYESRSFTIKINGDVFDIDVKSEFDQLLESMGMGAGAAQKLDVLKAPMPGLVLKTLVEPGAVVEKGDSLLVLEAMKMENIIKCPADGVVKSIDVQPSQTVEKNDVLISFEE